MFVKASLLYRCFDMAAVWRTYATAMDRRRPGSALGHNAFGRFTSKGMAYISARGSALLGQLNEFEGRPVFCVSHNAPATHRDMVGLLKKLSKDTTTPTALAVTEDLAGMLQRIGFRYAGTAPSSFRGELVEKQIFTNF